MKSLGDFNCPIPNMWFYLRGNPPINMKMTKTCAAMAFLATAICSSAAVMNITVDDTGGYLQNGAGPPVDPDLSLASIAFYSSFNAGSTANDPTSNLAFLQGVIGNWNSNYNPDLGAATTLAHQVDSIGGAQSFTAPAGYDYVVFHFGNGQAGAGGGPNNADENGWWSAWYLGGLSQLFTLPVEGNPAEPVGGFSSARFYNGGPPTNNVPDGGSTLVTLGAGLLGLGGIRRFLVKA